MKHFYAGILFFSSFLFTLASSAQTVIDFNSLGVGDDAFFTPNLTVNSGAKSFRFALSGQDGANNAITYSSGSPTYGNSNTPCLFLSSENQTHILTIETTDNSKFIFNSLFFGYNFTSEANTTFTFSAYRNGVVQATETFNVPGTADAPISYTFTPANSAFQNVDKITIASSIGFFATIDNFTWSAIALPPPVLTASGGNTAFTEGNNVTSTPVAVDPGITVTDANSTTLASATVSITGSFQSGQDVLAFTNNGSTMGNVAGSYNNGTGVLTLTSSGATATLAQWQAALRAVTYTNTSNSPNTTSRTISFVVNNGSSNSAAVTKIVSVTSVNDIPIVTASGGSAVFTQANNATSTPVAVDNNIAVSDLDNTSLASATVSITGNFQSGQDVLAFTNDGSTMGNVTGSYNSGTGVLTLTSSGATATVAQWQAALRAVTYTNTSNTPNTASRTVGFVVNDGTSNSTAVTRSVTVNAVNQTPVLTTSGGATSATEQVVAVVDNALTVADLNNTTLASATVSITGNFQSGQDVAAFTNDGSTMGNVTGSYNSGTGILTLNSSGATATVAQWQAALRAVTYTNTSNTPNTASRTISFVVNDGSSNSNIATKTVSVTSVNDIPVVTASGGAAVFTQANNATSTPVAVDNNITLSDLDNTTLASATVSITGNFQNGEDVLAFTNNGSTMGNVAGSYNSGTGVLTLTSSGATATVAQWQAALRAVTYTNTSNTPNTASRTVGFVVNDGISNSTAVTRSVTVNAVNQTPVLTTSGGITNAPEQVETDIDNLLTAVDLNNATLASATVSITGNFQNGQDVLVFTNNSSTMGNITGSYNNGTGVLTLTSSGATATLAQWQAALRAVAYTNTSNTPNTASRTISFVVNDGISNSNIATKTVAVTPVNDAPVAAQDSYIFAEGQALSMNVLDNDTDPENNQLTASLVTAPVNGVVVLNANGSFTYTPNVNFNGMDSIQYQVCDNGTPSLCNTAMVYFIITSVNNPPSINQPASLAVTEDVPVSLVGVSFADADADNNAVLAGFSVPAGSGVFSVASTPADITLSGTGTNSITITGTLTDINTWIAANGLLYTPPLNSTAPAVITISVNDQGNTGTGGALSATVTLGTTVTAVNDAPVLTVPGPQTVTQEQELTFSTANANNIQVTDVDNNNGSEQVTLTAANGVITLSATTGITFTAGTGTGDVTMTFEGSLVNLNNALSSVVFTPATGFYGTASLQVTINDQGNTGNGGAQTATQTIVIAVVQKNPLVASVQSTSPDGAYKAGDVIPVTVVFDQAVTVNTAGGIPYLTLETGAVDRNAVYASGSGTATLTFTYTVQIGDQSADLDYAFSSALVPNGATLRSTSGSDAILTLPATGGPASLGGQKAIVVDGIAPVISSVAVPANGTYGIGQNLDFALNFTEPVIVNTAGGVSRLAVTLDNGGTVSAGYLSGSGTNVLVYRLTLTNGQQDNDGIGLSPSIVLNGSTLRDAAGNDALVALNGVAATTGILVDAVAPSITASSTSPDTLNSVFGVRFTFSEPVTGFTQEDITVSNGTIINFTTVDGAVYTAVVTPAASGNVTVDVAADVAVDAGGNGNTAALQLLRVYDINNPSVSIDTVTNPSLNRPVQLIFRFSELVTGFTQSDITVNNATLSGFTVVDAQTYTVVVTPAASGSGIITVSVAANVAADVVGNGNTAALPFSYPYDAAQPVLSLSSTSGNPLNSAFTVRFAFSEPVTGFTQADITVSNGTLSGFTALDGATYTALVTPVASGSITVDVAAGVAVDVAGNGNTASLQLSRLYDVQQPALFLSSTSGNPLNSAFTVRFTFSEPVTGFTQADITVSNGTLSGFTAVDGATYTALVTPVASGIVTVNVAAGIAADAAGNSNTAGASLSRLYDVQQPSLLLSTPALDLLNGSFTVTFTFSKSVSGFDQGDILASNANLSAFNQVTPAIYSVLVTPLANGIITVSVPANAALDIAGNGNNTGNVLTRTFDGVPPAVSLTASGTDQQPGPYTVTIRFSEPVTGFGITDIVTTGATVSGFTTISSSEYTVLITPLGNTGVTTVDVPTGMATDQAGNGNLAAAQLKRVYDNTPPVATLINANTNIQVSLPYQVTILFSEPVTGFTQNDLLVTNASLSGFTRVNDALYTVTVTPLYDEDITLQVSAGAVTDAAGNSNAASLVLYNRALFNGGVDVIYPNPAREEVRIRFNGIVNKKGVVMLTNMHGRIMYSGEITLQDRIMIVPLSDRLPTGIYSLVVKTKDYVYRANVMIAR